MLVCLCCHARAQHLTLDVLLPSGFGALLPNLQELVLGHCVLTPAARTTELDTGAFSRLRRVVVVALSVQAPAELPAAPPPRSLQQQVATAQLRQLAKLPAFSGVSLEDSSCPTLFLVALGTLLTRLDLAHSYHQSPPGAAMPTLTWRSTLQHAARCTRLRELTIPCATAEELGAAAPALQHVRQLRLNSQSAAGGDDLVEALLGLPHLTSLEVDTCGWPMRRWHTESPCRWDRFSVGSIAPHQLARLPLHSLKQPVRWAGLVVHRGVSVREVRAAVANVTRRCQAGFRWEGATGPNTAPQLAVMLLRAADAAPVLRALQPLLAPLPWLEVVSASWDAELVRALGEALPRTCTRLQLSQGDVPGAAQEQLARSLPWLRRVEFKAQQASPEHVLGYVRLARRLRVEGGAAGVAVQLAEVVVVRPVRPGGVGEAQHKCEWDRAVRLVREEGRDVRLSVVW